MTTSARSFSFSLDVPRVVGALMPSLETALEEYPHSPVAPKRLSQQLLSWAEKVFFLPPDEGVRRVLLRRFTQAQESGISPAAATLSFLISQFHFQREEAHDARNWNETARRNLDGLPRLAQAAVRGQLICITLQSSELDDTTKLLSQLQRLELPTADQELLQPVLAGAALELKRAAGIYDLQMIPAGLPPWAHAFQKGRLFLQAARYNAAMAAFERAEEQLLPELETASTLQYIIRLQRARALLGLTELEEALSHFQLLEKHFVRLPLHGAKLSARQGTADVLRLRGESEEARAILQQVLAEANKLRLKKEAFRALLSIAACETTGNRFDQARSHLETAEGFLSSCHKKDHCTLNRRRAKLEFRAGDSRAALDYMRRAESLIAAGAKDEAAILRADLGAGEVWSLIREGRIGDARRKLERYAIGLKSVVENDQSDYHAETFPKLYQARLSHLRAYIDLREMRPADALLSCEATREVVGELGERARLTLLRVQFLEALAHGQLNDYPRGLGALGELEELGGHLGKPRPVFWCVNDLKRRDQPAVVDRLAFDLYDGFSQSSLRPMFERFEREFSLAIEPTRVISMKPGVEPLTESDWRATEAFVHEYIDAVEEDILERAGDGRGATELREFLDAYAEDRRAVRAQSIPKIVKRLRAPKERPGGEDVIEVWRGVVEELGSGQNESAAHFLEFEVGSSQY